MDSSVGSEKHVSVSLCHPASPFVLAQWDFALGLENRRRAPLTKAARGSSVTSYRLFPHRPPMSFFCDSGDDTLT